MALPDIARLNTGAGLAFIGLLRQHAIDAAYIRRMTHGPDDLRTPLCPTREAFHSGHPRAIAIRLFFCGVPVPAAEADLLFAPGLAGDLQEAGMLLNRPAGYWTFPFHLRIVRGLYLFSDYLGDEPAAVMGAAEGTSILYQASQPQRPIGRVLDLGCGAGTLALLLAADAAQVVATDVNPRAVALGRFNAAINGVGNIEFRSGDLFDAVAGERFHLIVSHPPYYPVDAGARPEETLLFLHGGERGDELATCIVDSIPAHLQPLGRGIVCSSWPDSSHVAAPPGYWVLELTTGRREPNGARPSLRVIQQSGDHPGWLAAYPVPDHCWGHVHAWRIDRIIAAENLVRGPDAQLLQAALKMPAGAARFEEGAQLFLNGPAESLLRFAPIDEGTWDLLVNIGAGVPSGRLDEVRSALRRGLLIIDEL